MRNRSLVLAGILLLLLGVSTILILSPAWSFSWSFVSREHAHLFDPTKVQPKDVVVGMEVVSNNTEVSGEFGAAGIVQFSGRATVSGVYEIVVDADSRSWVQFHVDDDSLGRLPRISNDTLRAVWFVFNNYDTARTAFGTGASSGRATIVIDNYRIHRAQTDAFNTADLVMLVRVH